jgi:hypothetical protein
MTTSFPRQYPELERTMRTETLDFIQVDYALDNRAAALTILPLAADRGMAVMINLPFGRGRLFQAVQGRELPPWASSFDCASWAQFFLKYIVSHPAVTCCVPGTAKVEYLLDNLGAAQGKLPDAESIAASLPGYSCRQVGGANNRSNGDTVQPRRKAASIGIGDHDLVCSGIQLYRKQDRHRRIEGAAGHFQGGRWAVVDGDVERPRTAGGVVDLELIRASLCDRDVRKRNSVLAAVTVVSHIGPARAEAAAADAGCATELCRLRLVGREDRSDRPSVTGDDDTIEIRRIGSGIAEGDRYGACSSWTQR